MATVLEANKESSELGGHIASYQSAATLYEVGFNHFWHAPSDDHGGDLVFMQGHCAPGFYARAFLEGRLSEDQLRRFRQEIGENGGFDGAGISSYPHPWLMPDFWQFPTVSMGLGPIMAIYQARFMKYLHGREIADTSGRKVWGFLGDGETDEPESLGAISMAGREKLDNLIFVVNCNLQRLDGPVRGNGKIIQELETVFRGAGWNVIKVVWGSRWDELLARDTEGRLLARMEEAVDGEYQAFKARDGAYVREYFFGKDPKLLEMVSDMSDDEIWALNRGGHDPRKIHAAYAAAVAHTGQPTVILAKTIKGYGMGEAGEGQNITHQQKKMTENALLAFRDRFELDLTDEEVHAGGFHRPPADSAEMTYLRERLDALGGGLPVRRAKAEPLAVPELSAFGAQLQGSGERENSTTMAFVRILNTLLRDKQIGRHVVPIVPDESRTFGMEGMFRQFGIFSQLGQLYQPEDSDQLMFYKEDKKGQILQEGINEPGAFAGWIAAATSYSNHDVPMIPFYIYYSMFGFQRVGDLAWAAGDSRARGFLLGGTAGRTTLERRGAPARGRPLAPARVDDPELRRLRPDLRPRGRGDHPGRPAADARRAGGRLLLPHADERELPPPRDAGGRRGGDRARDVPAARERRPTDKPRVQLLGSGTILREVLAAAELLEADHGVAADVWSVTSFTELARDGIETERWNRLHPTEDARRSYVATQFDGPQRAGDRVDRLHADVRGADPALPAGRVHRARHRRLRPQRLPRQAAPVLRGRPPLRHGGGAEGAGGRRRARAGRRAEGDRDLRHRPRPARAASGLRERSA